jgi:glycosyltransferase involved in cell wall biosynthesis
MEQRPYFANAMRIAFYAPLKPPDHPVPSGDRLMARLLLAALARAGHRAQVVSTMRSYSSKPTNTLGLVLEAATERERLAAAWEREPFDLWLTYHPYYKAPDLLGPPLSATYSVPYVTVESSYSYRRNEAGWAERQVWVLAGIRQAAVNVCLTLRDRQGLCEAAPGANVAMLAPFIDTAYTARRRPDADPHRMICVAMMRDGDKMDSYAMLARALKLLPERLPWRLAIVGDGPMASRVRALMAEFGGRIEWLGECGPERVATELAASGLYVWPGCGEAYGLAYLEAQAAGLAVVAQETAGVPEVVSHETTGLLTPQGDVAAFAEAIARILRGTERAQMGETARRCVLEHHSLDAAARRLDALLSWAAR